MKKELGEVEGNSLEKLIIEQMETVAAMVIECEQSFKNYAVKDITAIEELKEKLRQATCQIIKRATIEKLKKIEGKVAKANETHLDDKEELKNYKRKLDQEFNTLIENKERYIKKLEREAKALAAENKQMENKDDGCILL